MGSITVIPTADCNVTVAGAYTAYSAALLSLEHSGGDADSDAVFNCPWLPPAGSTVTSAKMRIYVTGLAEASLEVYRMPDAWGDGYGPSGVREPADLITTIPSACYNYSYTSVDIDLTSLVQGWIDGADNDGVLVHVYEEIVGANQLSVYASESYAYTRPRWIIEWDEGSTGDTTDPSVTITSPVAEETLTAETTVEATISDDTGVTMAEALVDGTSLGVLTSGPWEWTLDPASYANGAHVLLVRAWDAAGNLGQDSIAIGVQTVATAVVIVGRDVEAGPLGEWEWYKNPFYLRATGEGSPTRLLFSCDWVPPAGSEIVQALFYLFCDDGSWGAETPLVVSIYRAPGPWSNTVKLAFSGLAQADELVDGDAGTPDTGAWNAYDLTELVQSWVDGDEDNDGIVMAAASGNGAAMCSSRDHGWYGRAPRWYIEYIPAVVPDDTTAPIVEIISPVGGDRIAGITLLRAQISDDVGVDRAEAWVGGESLGVIGAQAGGMWEWQIDVSRLLNGAHEVVVRGWDAAGNMGEDGIVVVAYQSMAEATVVIYTRQMTGDHYSSTWRQDGYCDLAIEVVDIDATQVPLNPAGRYNLEIACAAPGVDADWDSMVPVTHRQSHGFAAQSPFCRWAIRARPQQVLASWLTGAVDALRLRDDEGTLLVLTSAPAVLRFTGDGFAEVADLTGYTPTDFAVWNGKLVICCGAQLLFWDPDSGEEPWVMEPPAGTTAFDVVETQGDDLYVGARIDAATGKLLRLDTDYDLTEIGSIERVTALRDCEASLAVGCVDGTIYSYAGTLTELYDAGDDAIGRLAVVGGEVLAGAGSHVFRNQPAWADEFEFAMIADVRAIGALGDLTYAGGDSYIVWLRVGQGDWIMSFDLADTTAVNDMLAIGDALYIATSSSTDARVFRLEVSQGTGLVCGPNRPDFRFKLLRRRGA